MLRTVAGVLVGFIAMFATVIALFGAVDVGMDPERLLEPGVYAPGLLVCVLGCGIGLLGAVVGGIVARKLGATRTAVLVLTLIVIALGGTKAVGSLSQQPRQPEARPAGEFDLVKRMKMVEPTWVAMANPVIGAVGLLLGGRAWRRV